MEIVLEGFLEWATAWVQTALWKRSCCRRIASRMANRRRDPLKYVGQRDAKLRS
jgi:hypothetical protein